MGKGNRDAIKATFTVVNQSYEDPEAGDKPQPVLVPTNRRTGRIVKKPAVRFGEDIEDDTYLRANMQMLDDDDEDGIFEDEVEEDFDNDFVKQMMDGTGVEDEEFEEMEDDEYPVHEERRQLEKNFDRMMDQFDEDEEIDEDDPRAQGPLSVEEYAPALEEFMREHVGGSYLTEGAPHHQGLINQLKGMALEHGVFDSNEHGTFVTTLESDKSKRVNIHFHEDVTELRKLTLDAVRQGVIDTRDVLYIGDDEEAKVALKMPTKQKDKHDCETILSTVSNIYNRPTVIAAGTKKLKLSLAAAKQNKAAKHVDAVNAPSSASKKSPAVGPTKITAGPSKLTLAAAAEPVEATRDEEDDLFDDLPDEALPSLVDLSTRARDETKEEKQMRRAIVKELQRERRAQKKTTKTAYKEAGIAHNAVNARQKNDKAMVSLSVVRRS